MSTRAVLLALTVVLATAASASAGSGPDKAGGHAKPNKPARGKPVVLTLATGDQPFGEAYAGEVARLSRGMMRIDVRLGRTAQANYERFTVEDVRKGKAQLGSVAARVWDTMGATSMQALVAPLLVDSLALQKRVLESPLATQMLAGLASAGVVGLALTPGPLRRPLGLTRPLLGPQDYRGATIGIKFGGVARSTFETLGAKVTGYTWGQTHFDGAELDLKTIADAEYDLRAKQVTANVVLWARPQTMFANRDAFARLTAAQREILRRAGREVVRPEAGRVEREQTEALTVICGRSATVFASASPSELAALRRAVRPVYTALERDPQTRRLIAAIRKLAGRAETNEPSCAGQDKSAATALEGTWRSTVSRQEMLAGGASLAEAATYFGTATLELKDGKWVVRGERATLTGTYSVNGNLVQLTMRTCTANPCSPGMTTTYGWSVYRDSLSLAPRSAITWPRLVAKPLSRVR
jgi:TRAP-type C4-dicarboxylate transport system substrate-binding protein